MQKSKRLSFGGEKVEESSTSTKQVLKDLFPKKETASPQLRDEFKERILSRQESPTLDRQSKSRSKGRPEVGMSRLAMVNSRMEQSILNHEHEHHEAFVSKLRGTEISRLEKNASVQSFGSAQSQSRLNESMDKFLENVHAFRKDINNHKRQFK